MSIKITDLAATYPVYTWALMPGIEIQKEYKDNPRYAQKAFKQFIAQIPKIKSLMAQLRQERFISEIHLPLSLSTIFFVFLDELIDVYQNQFEQRNKNIDLKLQEIKRLCAKKCDLGWDTGPEELPAFFSEIKEQLKAEGALPQNFDMIINVWKEILSVKYMGDLQLAALFEKRAESSRLLTQTELDSSPTELDFSPHEKSKAIFKGHSFFLLSRSDLEQSFFLLLRQLVRDATWILPELLQKIALIEDKELDQNLTAITKTGRRVSSKEPNSLLAIEYVDTFNEIISKTISIEINNNDSIKTNLFNCENERVICEEGHTKTTAELKKNIHDKFHTSYGDAGKITIALIEHLENYNMCYFIKKCYLVLPRFAIKSALESLVDSNNTWELFNKTKAPPLLYSKVQPLLPPISVINDQWLESLDSSSQTTKVPQPKASKKKKLGNPATPPKKVVPINRVIDSQIAEIKTPIQLVLSPLERLKLKLRSLHQAAPSRALRQALWHLDSLTVIQNSLTPSKINAPHCLCLAAIVVNSSQKVLEQTYRFCLKEENAPLERTHNLKDYHKKFEPNYVAFPAIVNDLFLANNWYRYFYAEHTKWYNLTMNLASIPPVLNLLVKIADGQPLSPPELEKFIEGTIEDVRKHTEFLIKSREESPPHAISMLQLSEIKGPLLKKASFRDFGLASKALEQVLTKSKLYRHHPALLHLKQALAAMKMLKISQEKISQANDVGTFSIWTVWSLQQLQESMENVLHAIEHLQNGETSINHEMESLSAKVGLDFGPLANVYQKLSYKARYPAEVLIESLAAEIIDDLEAIKQFPEILEGFTLQTLPAMLWTAPRQGLSIEGIAKKLGTCMLQSEEFLRLKVIPLLAANDKI